MITQLLRSWFHLIGSKQGLEAIKLEGVKIGTQIIREVHRFVDIFSHGPTQKNTNKKNNSPPTCTDIFIIKRRGDSIDNFSLEDGFIPAHK
jgi:hypothetical protein